MTWSAQGKRIAKLVGGVILIIIGIIGLVIPILPGLVFIYFGLELLGFGLVIRALVEKYREKYWPKNIDK